jgi:hypothetical protein
VSPLELHVPEDRLTQKLSPERYNLDQFVPLATAAPAAEAVAFFSTSRGAVALLVGLQHDTTT